MDLKAYYGEYVNTQTNLYIQGNPYQNPNRHFFFFLFLFRNGKTDPETHTEHQLPHVVKKILRKSGKV